MSQNPLDPTGRSICTQVAFKGAIEAASVGADFNLSTFEDVFPVLTAQLLAAVEAQSEEYFAIATAKKAERIADGTYTGGGAAPTPITDAFAAEFGATPVGGVEVAGKQHGPLPAWLAAAAAAKGVTKVWDNRISRDGEDITKKMGKTPPWFKSTEGDIPFWPPRN